MRSGAFQAGQFDLKGNKEVRLGCGCCTARNLKEKYEEKRIEKKIREEKYEDV